MKILIAANGTPSDPGRVLVESRNSDFIVAADGGAAALHECGIRPDAMLGDFDSVAPDLLEQLSRENVEIQTFPAAKDLSDLELCFQYVLSKSPTEVVIARALGGRSDYIFTNILGCLTFFANRIPVRILEGSEYVLTPMSGPFRGSFTAVPGTLFSLVPLGTEVLGVNLSGSRWELSQAILGMGSLTISNEVLSGKLDLEFSTGNMFIRYHEAQGIS